MEVHSSQGSDVKPKAVQLRCVLPVAVTGLKTYSKRFNSKTHILRFQNNIQLTGLCGLLGEASIAGVRKPRPKLSKGSATAKSNDSINVVVGYDEEDAAFTKSTNRSGVDLEYSGIALNIYVRYRKYVYHTLAGGNPGSDICSDDDVDPDFFTELAKGMIFQGGNNSLYKIKNFPATQNEPVLCYCL
jgi:hypothetical protein